MNEAKRNALTVTLPSDLEIKMTRVFNAPRRLVFDCYTKPEHLTRWFGRRGDSLSVCEVDLRVGGAYRFVFQLREGGEMAMRGVYHEIASPERLVNTEIFDDYADLGETVGTLVLEERDGKTYMTATSLYSSKEARDGMIESGMEGGAGESFDRLEELMEAAGMKPVARDVESFLAALPAEVRAHAGEASGRRSKPRCRTQWRASATAYRRSSTTAGRWCHSGPGRTTAPSTS